jgi:polygalacturonase
VVITRAALSVAVFCCAAFLSAAAPYLPVIPNNNFNITNYGGVSSPTLTNTAAISNAIFAANAAGGGTVQIPAGTYLSGPFGLKNRIRLQLDPGATLKMLPYGSFPSSATELITASSLNNIEVSGGGTIEGQGSAWWTNLPSIRPVLFAMSSCHTVLVQNVTFQNSPKMHVTVKGTDDNLTFKNITISSPSTSPNTDGIDLIGTSCLVQDCTISTGDDNIAIGSTGGTANGIVITNCAFGTGHGMSIGSNTRSGVSNLTVINCSFNGTQYGIRMKSDNSVSSGGAGGIARNLSYYNLMMTNITRGPIVIYSYYNTYGTPTAISPATAASMPVDPVNGNTPVWGNIVISNLYATVPSGGIAGIIWGRTEMPVTNIALKQITITAPSNFDLYNITNLTLENVQVNVTGGGSTYSVYNTGLEATNAALVTSPVSFDGLAATNSFAFYNARVAMADSTVLTGNPLTLASATLSNATSTSFPVGSIVNFGLGTNTTRFSSAGPLTLNSVINIFDGGGLAPGTYSLFTYTDSLGGTPSLGTLPAGFTGVLDTTVGGQVRVALQQTNAAPPRFSSVFRVGNAIILSGTGAPPSTAVALLSSTNITLPLSNWAPVATNLADNTGAFSFTNGINPSRPAEFFSSRVQ